MRIGAMKKQTQNKPNLSRRSLWRSRIKPNLVRHLVRRSPLINPCGTKTEAWRRRIQKGYLTALRSVVLRSIPYGITEDKY